MGALSDPSMTTKFKTVFAKLKGRRRADSTKMKMAAAAAVACVHDAPDSDSQLDAVTAGVDSMEISTSTTTTPSLPIPPSGTFDFCPPPSSPVWPGPRYDDLVQFVPGIFNRSRDMMLSKSKPKSKRAVAKRRSSQDDRHAALLRPTSKTSKPATPKKASTTPKKPQFCPPPPTRPEPLHLLTLPGELRNEIYRHLYVSPTPLQASYRPILTPHQGNVAPPLKRFPREPALALACRQLRREAASLFYAENAFVFAQAALVNDYLPGDEQPMTCAAALTRWMRASTGTAALGRMELRFGGTGKADEYGWQPVGYVFRRRADGRVELSVELAKATRCVCYDRKLRARFVETVLPLTGEDGRRPVAMKDAVVALAAGRGAELKATAQKASVVRCRECGKPGWR